MDSNIAELLFCAVFNMPSVLVRISVPQEAVWVVYLVCQGCWQRQLSPQRLALSPHKATIEQYSTLEFVAARRSLRCCCDKSLTVPDFARFC